MVLIFTATYPNAYGQLSQAFTTQQPAAVMPTPQREGKLQLYDLNWGGTLKRNGGTIPNCFSEIWARLKVQEELLLDHIVLDH